MAKWSLLTNHARLLLAIEDEPGLRVRDLADRVGVTERAIHLMLRDLRDAGYLDARREGRRTSYSVVDAKPLDDSPFEHPTVGRPVPPLPSLILHRSTSPPDRRCSRAYNEGTAPA